MPNTAQSDIAYQPAQKGFSYYNTNPVTPETPQPEAKKPNIILSLVIELFVLLTVFAVFLGILNYFKIISLPFFPSSQNQAFTPEIISSNEDTGAVTYKTSGTLYGYNDYIIKLNINNKIVDFIWNKDTGASNIPTSAELQKSILLSDIENQTNLGKKTTIEFAKDSAGNYVIQAISF